MKNLCYGLVSACALVFLANWSLGIYSETNRQTEWPIYKSQLGQPDMKIDLLQDEESCMAQRQIWSDQYQEEHPQPNFTTFYCREEYKIY